MKCSKALKKLKEGNKRFVQSIQINQGIGASINSNLVTSQKPFAIILTCSDSRVGVDEIFDTKLGDLFIVKNAGNIVDKSTLATIEYGVSVLNIKLIVVLSHQNCGAVKYAKKHPETNLEKDKNIDFLLHQIRYVLSENKEISTKKVTEANANHSADRIMQHSLIVADKVNKGKAKIVTSYYKISTGKVTFL